MLVYFNLRGTQLSLSEGLGLTYNVQYQNPNSQYPNMKDIFPYYSIGHFINQPETPTEFEITLFEEMEEPDVDDWHKHTFYEIIWTDAGRSTQHIDYQHYKIHPNTFFFISPGQLHYFEEWQDLKGGSIFFTEDFFLFNQQHKDRLFEFIFLDNFYINPCLQLDKQAFVECREVIDLLLREKSRKDYSADISRSLLQILLYQIQRCIETNSSNQISKKYLVIYKKFKRLIDQHFKSGYTSSQYAEMLHITQHHLNLISKHVTGKTATELVRQRTLLEAKRLLTFTDYTITEIAAELGYFDSSYFAKIFRAETGLSPGAFKKPMSEKYRI